MFLDDIIGPMQELNSTMKKLLEAVEKAPRDAFVNWPRKYQIPQCRGEIIGSPSARVLAESESGATVEIIWKPCPNRVERKGFCPAHLKLYQKGLIP